MHAHTRTHTHSHTRSGPHFLIASYLIVLLIRLQSSAYGWREHVYVQYSTVRECVCVCLCVCVCPCMDTSMWVCVCVLVCIHVFPSPLCIAWCAWRKWSSDVWAPVAPQRAMHAKTQIPPYILTLTTFPPPEHRLPWISSVSAASLSNYKTLRCLCPLVIRKRLLFISTPPHLAFHLILGLNLTFFRIMSQTGCSTVHIFKAVNIFPTFFVSSCLHLCAYKPGAPLGQTQAFPLRVWYFGVYLSLWARRYE